MPRSFHPSPPGLRRLLRSDHGATVRARPGPAVQRVWPVHRGGAMPLQRVPGSRVRRQGAQHLALNILDVTLPVPLLRNLMFEGLTLEADAIFSPGEASVAGSAFHLWHAARPRRLFYLEYASRRFDVAYLRRILAKAALVRCGRDTQPNGWPAPDFDEPLVALVFCASVPATMHAMLVRWVGEADRGVYALRERHLELFVLDLRRLPIDRGYAVLRFLRPTRSERVWRSLIRHLHSDPDLGTHFRERLFRAIQTGEIDMNEQQRIYTWQEVITIGEQRGERKALLALAERMGASPAQLAQWAAIEDPAVLSAAVEAWIARRS